MPWFKVDDKLHDHRKARSAGATAMGVWVLAGSWAADNLTDGFVPATILPRWGRPRDAKRLTEVGLWYADEQDGEEGWRFHEWAERQPTRAQKLAERALRAEAGRVGGKASGRSRREANPKQVASVTVEPPSRPVPTRPVLPSSELASASSDGKPSRAEVALFDQAPTAQSLVAEWIDHCAGKRPPSRVIGQVSKELKALLDEGIEPDRVRAALAEWNRKGLHPSTLASVVHEISNRKPTQRGQQATDDLFDRAMQRALERDSA